MSPTFFLNLFPVTLGAVLLAVLYVNQKITWLDLEVSAEFIQYVIIYFASLIMPQAKYGTSRQACSVCYVCHS